MAMDNAAIAKQLGYSKEEMIAKFGNPGEKSPTEIGNALGLDSSTITSIFGTPQVSESSSDFSNVSVGNLVAENIDNDALATQLGYSKEEMEAKFGKPGETDPKDIAAQLGLSDEEAANIFGEPLYTEAGEETKEEDETTKKTSKDEKVDSSEKTKDDKYKEIADATGYDRKTVSAIAKAVANGNAKGAPEEVVPKLAKDLGVSQEAVSAILAYLNNGTI